MYAKLIPSETTGSEPKKPRLKKLIIKNFRSIGHEGMEIDLDEIVVLVGPNNVGKSSILRAYELVMLGDNKAAMLTIEDFPNRQTINHPIIELHTVVYDNSPGEKWIIDDNGEKLVKEKWTWNSPNVKPIRFGWIASESRWATSEDKQKVPWGAANVAKSKRPEPHRVSAFDSPNEQGKEIVRLLKSYLTDKVKEFTADGEEETDEHKEYKQLIESVKRLQNKIVEKSKNEIEEIEKDLTELISKVFPGYSIKFDAKPENEIDKAISWFKEQPDLLMGPESGYQSTIDRQGSGARRTLLWTALRLISEHKAKEGKPHLLLIDEPEICLHPNATRAAREVLYDLPKAGNWQVMLTTHSPVFIDISKDNTTITRVQKSNDGRVSATTIYRPDNANLTEDDKLNLKLMNVYDPYFAEFFFGGRTIVVEGDTEYSAFNYLKSISDSLDDVHIIRARGKASIVTVIKILNQFGVNYSVLHDTDKPKAYRKDGSEIANPAWTNNMKILSAVNEKDSRVTIRLVASVDNFEEAYLDSPLKGDKPYNALNEMVKQESSFEEISTLFDALVSFEKDLPDGALEWSDITELERIFE
ncbi:AAA family ATPase [uncultured Croceitalea sp.]|uniref:ATP-dependent nuclease n=1 Tax=uncultured Croceitalea sp. TaxID=1798908 RepID=UPI003305D3A4